MAGESAVRAAGELAAEFDGAVARWQLLEQGHPPSRVDHWLAIERMFVKYPGVYAWGRPDLPEKGELFAGLMFAGRGSALGGLSMLWWCELLGDRPGFIHIDAPGRAASRQDLRIRHPRSIVRLMHRDLPLTDLASALLAATPKLTERTLRLCLARADFHDLLHLPSLHAACRSGPRGSKALRAAMAIHLPQLARCVNDFEIDFVLLCESAGLPIPEPNVRKGHFVPDMTWESHRLIVELDGKGAHTSPAQKHADQTKQDWLEGRGYTVVRFTWEEVYFRRDWVIATVRATLQPIVGIP